ncbi:hypothetical protein N8Z81_04915 [Akkermansiaceae bacterium]|nr:hypothetical protein [Akkermansiaceae bacterium]
MISSLILLGSVEASVIVRQMNVESLARQATLDLDENGTSDLFLTGSHICTRDIPISTCIYSVTARGAAHVEFLLRPDSHTSPILLEKNQLLGESNLMGEWSKLIADGLSLRRTVNLRDASTEGRDGTDFTTEPSPSSDRFWGFRILDDAVDWHYGWIQANGESTAISAVGYELDANQSIRVIPEPSVSLLLGIWTFFGLSRRARSAG